MTEPEKVLAEALDKGEPTPQTWWRAYERPLFPWEWLNVEEQIRKAALAPDPGAAGEGRRDAWNTLLRVMQDEGIVGRKRQRVEDAARGYAARYHDVPPTPCQYCGSVNGETPPGLHADPMTGETLRGAIAGACDLVNPRLSEVDWDQVAAVFDDAALRDTAPALEVERL